MLRRTPDGAGVAALDAERTPGSALALDQRERVRAALRAAAADAPGAALARHLAAIRLRWSYRGTLQAEALAHRIEPADMPVDEATRAGEGDGVVSPEQRAAALAKPVVDRATSWPVLHRGLAALGIGYEDKGSGAVLAVDGVVLKASSYRPAGRQRLEARLGPFQPRPADMRVAGGRVDDGRTPGPSAGSGGDASSRAGEGNRVAPLQTAASVRAVQASPSSPTRSRPITRSCGRSATAS